MILCLLSGCLIGVFLGLMGAGGSALAIPLFLYILDAGVSQATTLSMIVVGGSALFGTIQRFLSKDLDLKVALMFSSMTVIGAPLGVKIATLVFDPLRMVLFALLMLSIAIRLWRQSGHKTKEKEPKVVLDKKKFIKMIPVGLLIGIFSGFFGIGGGFFIVPSLMFYFGLSIYRASATSLFVIAMTTFSGLIYQQIVSGGVITWQSFDVLLAGIVGMYFGIRYQKKISPRLLSRVFSIVIFFLAIFVGSQNILALLLYRP